MRFKNICFLLLFVSFFLSMDASESKYRVTKLYNKGWIQGHVSHTHPGLEIPKLEVARDVSTCGSDARAIQAVQIGQDGALQNAVVFLKQIEAGKPFTLAGEPP